MRQHFTAAAAAACLSSGAAMASVVDIDLTLRLDSMTTSNVTILHDGEETFETLDLSENSFGIEHPFQSLSLGDEIEFKAEIIPTAEGSSGQAKDCSIGRYNCDTSEFEGLASVSASAFSISDGSFDFFSISGSTPPDSAVTFTWCNDFRCSYAGPNGLEAFFDDVVYQLTVIDTNEPDLAAVVPVPASLPLLAAGLLGLAFLRRRRTR